MTIMTVEVCRRGHVMSSKNVRKQTNTSARADGTKAKYKVRVCKACTKKRRDARAAGKPLRDLRKGRRP